MRSRALDVAAVCAALLLAACSRAPAPRELAFEFDRAHVETPNGPGVLFPGARLVEGADGYTLRIAVGGATDVPLAAVDGYSGVLHAHVPALSVLVNQWSGDRQAEVVRGDGTKLVRRDFDAVDLEAERPLAPGEFAYAAADLFVADEVEEGALELRVPVRRAVRHGDHWRVAMAGLVADGFDLWQGERWSFDVREKGPLRLDATFATLGKLAPQDGSPWRVEWSLEHDGRRIAGDVVEPEVGELALTPIAVELGERRGRFTLSVRGLHARTAFICPRLRSARSASDSPRRDIAIFLADTFRADLLGRTTTSGSLTPNLDRFAADALVFEDARSPSSWTLPAHVSMFTSLQPAKHGVLSTDDRLPADVGVTLAERLRRAGYRTVAVTNAGFVSRGYGVERGFEFFHEWRATNDVAVLLDTLRTVLAVEDERPLFLFFHTYRTHDPYVVEAATRERHGAALGITDDFFAVMERFAPTGWKLGTNHPAPAGFAREIDALRALYTGGAADLDRGFEEWLDLVARHGRDDVVLFTSDHGEAFGERDGRVGHSLGLWEDQLRVPFVLRGPGVRAGRVRAGATLMDVPRTIAALADVAPAPAWEGRALPLAPLAPAGEVSLEILGGPTSVAVYEGSRKVYARGEGLVERDVFDLAADPWELGAQAGALEPWADATITRLAARPGWNTPLAPPDRASLAADHLAQLAKFGYLDRQAE